MTALTAQTNEDDNGTYDEIRVILSQLAQSPKSRPAGSFLVLASDLQFFKLQPRESPFLNIAKF